MEKEEVVNVRRIVKRYGNSLVIILRKEDCELYDIKEGNSLEINFGSVKR